MFCTYFVAQNFIRSSREDPLIQSQKRSWQLPRSARVGAGIPAGGFGFCSRNERCSVGSRDAGEDLGCEDRAVAKAGR